MAEATPPMGKHKDSVWQKLLPPVKKHRDAAGHAYRMESTATRDVASTPLQ